MKKGLAQLPEAEFDAWVEAYFQEKTDEDLRNILIGYNPRLAAYFSANPIISGSEPLTNPLTSSILAWLQTDRPPGYITIPDFFKSPEFRGFFVCFVPA